MARLGGWPGAGVTVSVRQIVAPNGWAVRRGTTRHGAPDTKSRTSLGIRFVDTLRGLFPSLLLRVWRTPLRQFGACHRLPMSAAV